MSLLSLDQESKEGYEDYEPGIGRFSPEPDQLSIFPPDPPTNSTSTEYNPHPRRPSFGGIVHPEDIAEDFPLSESKRKWVDASRSFHAIHTLYGPASPHAPPRKLDSRDWMISNSNGGPSRAGFQNFPEPPPPSAHRGHDYWNAGITTGEDVDELREKMPDRWDDLALKGRSGNGLSIYEEEVQRGGSIPPQNLNWLTNQAALHKTVVSHRSASQGALPSASPRRSRTPAPALTHARSQSTPKLPPFPSAPPPNIASHSSLPPLRVPTPHLQPPLPSPTTGDPTLPPSAANSPRTARPDISLAPDYGVRPMRVDRAPSMISSRTLPRPPAMGPSSPRTPLTPQPIAPSTHQSFEPPPPPPEPPEHRESNGRVPELAPIRTQLTSRSKRQAQRSPSKEAYYSAASMSRQSSASKLSHPSGRNEFPASPRLPVQERARSVVRDKEPIPATPTPAAVQVSASRSSSEGKDGSGDKTAAKGKKETKRYPCPEPGCGKSFTRKNDVARHLKSSASHRDIANVAKDFKCKYCGRILSRGDSARRHEAENACGKRTLKSEREALAFTVIAEDKRPPPPMYDSARVMT